MEKYTIEIESKKPITIISTEEYNNLIKEKEELERRLKATKEYCEIHHSRDEEKIQQVFDILFEYKKEEEEEIESSIDAFCDVTDNIASLLTEGRVNIVSSEVAGDYDENLEIGVVMPPVKKGKSFEITLEEE